MNEHKIPFPILHVGDHHSNGGQEVERDAHALHVTGVRSRVGRAHEYLPVVEGLWGTEVIDQGALILEPEATESLHLSFGDLDGGVEQGPGDDLIAGGGGEGALVAVEGVAVAGDEGREGVEAFHVLVHTGRLDLLEGLDDRCKSWVVGGGDLEQNP